MISLSVAPSTSTIGKHYYDLSGTLELMQRLEAESVVDGVEFQNLAEWDAAQPPLDEREKRLPRWRSSPKYTVAEIGTLLRDAMLPVISIHANRDVGICLCSGQEEKIERGKTLIHDALFLTEHIGATVCVFHLWDTWKGRFDPGFLHDTLAEIAIQYPGAKASVENIPTHLADATPISLVQGFEWITLDLQWAAMYDELNAFQSLRNRIANVHLRGRLEDGKWVLSNAPFLFYQALDIIKNHWGYKGPLTMEPTGLCNGDWDELVAAMSSLSR